MEIALEKKIGACGCRSQNLKFSAGGCESCALRLVSDVVSDAREVDEDVCLTHCSASMGDITLNA